MLLSPSPPCSLLYINRRRRHRRRRIPSAVSGGDVDGFTESSGYLFDLSESSETEYSAASIASVYRRRPATVLRRVVQVGATLGWWFVRRYMDGVTEQSESMFEVTLNDGYNLLVCLAEASERVRAAELRKILVQLGPAYIKIAQAISSRSDLVPPSYLDELSLLQDRIAPFSTEVAFSMIERELGLPIEEIFSEISPEPIAAASLGQVYQARLRKSGKVVAVKVQRPGVQAAISLDILILRFIAGLIRRAGKFNTDLQAVVDEWASSLFREMDYQKEAKNGIKFRQLYGSIQDVVVPEMYMEQTTSRVLVMQWVEGQKLSEVKDLYLVEIGVYCSFNQLLEYGFYHADPHPGNLLRTTDGKLAYLDFGMMGTFKQELRDGFMEACLHLVNRDYDALAKDFVTLGLLPPTSDKDAVTEALTGVFKDAVAKGVRSISFGDLLGNLGTTMYKFKFQIPSYFSLVIRSLAVLEGIAIGIDPTYKVLGGTYPYIAKKVLTDSSPQLQLTLQSLLYKGGVFRIDRLESLLTESLRAKTEKALVEKSIEDTDSKMVVKQILQFTLTEKGTFLREILLQEFAKGLEALGLATLDSFTSNVPFVSTIRGSFLTDEDVINLRTLQRLALLLSSIQSYEENSGTETDTNQRRQPTEASIMLNQFASVRDMLPLLSVISELPPSSQQEVFRLPAELAGKLLSRIAARTVRRSLL